MSVSLTNWKISKNEEGEVSITAWIDSNEHRKFQLNKALKIFFTGTSNSGRGVSRSYSEYYEYVFKTKSFKRMKNNDIWTFQIGQQLIIFSFGNRAQNKQYCIQTLEEIQAITNC